jgi:hypothetical protein
VVVKKDFNLPCFSPSSTEKQYHGHKVVPRKSQENGHFLLLEETDFQIALRIRPSLSARTTDASLSIDGISHLKSKVAAKAPASWAATNPTVSFGLIPAKVFVRDRATVTAGLANDVDAVNQYAAMM